MSTDDVDSAPVAPSRPRAVLAAALGVESCALQIKASSTLINSAAEERPPQSKVRVNVDGPPLSTRTPVIVAAPEVKSGSEDA